ncbi:MAG: hypothetical protein AAF141_01755 [Pseudomonadota bacterium]
MRITIALAILALAATPAIAMTLKPATPAVSAGNIGLQATPVTFVTKAKDMPGTRVMDRNGRDLGFVQYVQDSETLRIQFRNGGVRDVPARQLRVIEHFRNRDDERREFQIIYEGR